MAILKQRLRCKNSSGTYDTVYLETCATVINMSETDTTKLSAKISSMDTAIAGKQAAGNYQPAGSYAAASHTHDDRYYTESEVNTKLNAKQDSSSAINTSNIGSQSVNYANSAGSANSASSSTYATYASSSSNYGQLLRNQGLSSSASTPSANGEIIWQYS